MRSPMPIKASLIQTILSLSAILTLVAPSGCGSQETGGGRGDRPPIIEERPTGEQPAQFSLVDQGACQQGTISLTETVIHAWEGERAERRKVALEGIATIDGVLVGQAVKHTTYQDIYERTCDASKFDGQWCKDHTGNEKGWTQNTKASRGTLAVCQDKKEYPRESFEAVGLASLYYTDAAYAAFRRVSGKELPPLRLSVLPHFITYYEYPEQDGVIVRRKAVLTNNMAYFPSVPMIAAFPHPAGFAEKHGGYFWESAFVLAHEYGHHVDHSNGGGVCSVLGLVWNPLTHSYEAPEGEHYGLAGGSVHAKVCSAAAEGFADLVAFYTVNGDTRSLAGLPCFGYNRTVSTADFENGDAKVLTPDRYRVLIGLAHDEDTQCGKPRYGDVHIAGAIFAHVLDKAFARVTSLRPEIAPESPEDYEHRYRLALAWLAETTSKLKDLNSEPPQSVEGYIAPLASALEVVINHELRGFPLRADDARRDICQLVKEGWPALPEPPFGC